MFFSYSFLFSLAKLSCKKIMAKKKTEANFGNVCGNVPKICKRFKSVFLVAEPLSATVLLARRGSALHLCAQHYAAVLGVGVVHLLEHQFGGAAAHLAERRLNGGELRVDNG